MKKPICITFSGCVGSSKSPITNYLSYNFNLPVFNNDAIRSEILEDFGEFNKDEYILRRNERCLSILESGKSFIFDASVDREWENLKLWLDKYNYDTFIISLDLSEKLLTKLYKAKNYSESLERLPELIKDHELFLEKYSKIVNLHITDELFLERLEISRRAVNEIL
ncbi:hypothetical protein M0P65_04155 [Candidatus Gracilibacteria bacterium]|nr:hypothetical protein [Candidatus Gracilibacteria bacterium]